MYDAIIIGGGHSGLTSAAYLARAGRHVLVLESRSIVGGYATSEETIAAAPGFVMNGCAVDTVLVNIAPSIIDELQLSRYGLRFVKPDPWATFVNPGGETLALWRDFDRTVKEIRHFSKRDAERFEAFYSIMLDVWRAVVPYLMDHPTRPRPRTVAEILWYAFRGHRSLRKAARLLIPPPDQVLAEQFESEEVKAFLGNLAAWSSFPLREPGTGGVLLQFACFYEYGVTRPVGGAGAFTTALADCARAHGAEIRTDAAVEKVLVRDGAAQGVALANGEELRARHVMGAIDPARLMNDLVDEQWVPRKLADELGALRDVRWNIGMAKGDAALSGRPKLATTRSGDTGELWQGYLILSPTIDYVDRAQIASIGGEIPEEIPMGVVLPSVVDRSLVPPDSDGETLYIYFPMIPRDLSGGRSWADEKGPFMDRAMGILEGYMPGLEDMVIGTYIKGPDEMRQTTSGGNLNHVDATISQLGPWRPTPSLAGYRTPVAGLWNSGVGAHPFGGLSGWGGRTAARTVERALAKSPPQVLERDLRRQPPGGSGDAGGRVRSSAGQV